MADQPHTTRKDQRVRLKSNGEDNLYMFAAAGSEGWVRDQTHDPTGFPMVLIEWDKNDWRYNGEPNRWTFEAHFEPVEDDKMADEAPKLPEGMDPQAMMAAFAQFLQSQTGDTSGAVSQQSAVDAETAKMRGEFDKLVTEVSDRLHTPKVESMLVLWVEREKGDGPDQVLVPRVANYYMTPESGYLLESHLSKLAAMAHDEAVMARIDQILRERASGGAPAS
jgi:hypothetical protein